MKTDFSEILKLLAEISNSTFCYLFKTGIRQEIVAYNGNLDPTAPAIKKFNTVLRNLGINNIKKIKETEAFNNLNSQFNITSIDISAIFETDDLSFYLVILTSKPIRSKKIKSQIESVKKILADSVQIVFGSNKKQSTDISDDDGEIRERLEKSEEKFNLLIETAVDLIFSLNGFGYFVQVNENGAKSLGFTPQEMLGKHFLEFIDEDKKAEIATSFQKILSCTTTTYFEAELVHKLNKKLTYEFLVSPTRENGTISGMLAIGRDITNRKKYEVKIKELHTKLEQANRLVSIERDRAKQQITILEEINRLKNEFVSNVSHELRTPLASIVGFAETLSSDEDLPRELINEFSNIILTEGKRLAKFIEDILDFSELESGVSDLKKDDFDLIKILNELLSTLKSQITEKKIILTTEIPEAEIIIFADEEKLIKAFSVIIENAVNVTNSGGRIKIIVQDFLKEVEVIISDTSAGIAEKDLESLFDSYHPGSLSDTGISTVGMGLSLVKQIFDHHKGLVQVKSEINQGTTFIIRLPKKINERG